MNKQLIFRQVSEKVSEVTGIPIPLILSSTNEDCTDARFLLVRTLSYLDWSDVDIAKSIGRTRQAVGHLRTKYKKSKKWTIGNDWKTIVKWIENEYFTSK